MHEMVDRLPDDDAARHRNEYAVAHLERPWLRPVVVAHALEGRARLRYERVESLEQSFGAVTAVATPGREVERIIVDHANEPTWHRRNELGEVAEGKRFGMRLPLAPVRGHAFDHAPGHGHLLIELGKQRCSDGHRFSSWLAVDQAGRRGCLPAQPVRGR